MLELTQYGSVAESAATLVGTESGKQENSKKGTWGSKSAIAMIGTLLALGAVIVWTQRTKKNSVGRVERLAVAAAGPPAMQQIASDAVKPGYDSVVKLKIPFSNPVLGILQENCLGAMIDKDLIITQHDCVATYEAGHPILVNNVSTDVQETFYKSMKLVAVIRLKSKTFLTDLGVKRIPLIKSGLPVPFGKKADVYGVGSTIVDKSGKNVGEYRLGHSLSMAAIGNIKGGPVFYTTGGTTYLFGVSQKYDASHVFVGYLGTPTVGDTVRALVKAEDAKCPLVMEVVCGSDGKTYDHPCLAKRASAAVSCSGECPCASLGVVYNCPAGTYEISRSASGCVCEKCPAGTSCAGGPKSTPKDCAPGFYQPLTGQKECRPASPGYKAPGQKSTKQTQCPAGEYQSKAGQTSCHQCPTGHKCPSPGTSTPEKCRAGYFQPKVSQTGCVPASPGNEVPTPGSPSESPCPAGTYQNMHGQSKCKDCPLGHECPGKGNTKPISCPIGSYTSKLKSASCTACPAGNECPHKGMRKPNACPINTYQHCTGQPGCIPCAAGKTQPKTGQTSC